MAGGEWRRTRDDIALTVCIMHVVAVTPTGDEKSLKAFKEHYESSEWCIAKATCVKQKIRDEAIFHSDYCDGKTLLFNGEEDGLFVWVGTSEYACGRPAISMPDGPVSKQLPRRCHSRFLGM